MTSNHLNKLEQYLIDCIDNSGYDAKPLATVHGKLAFLRRTFLAEYGWRVAQVGETKAIADWLAGLPSAINIAFYNHDVLELASPYKLDLLKENASEIAQDKFLNNWFNLLATRLYVLWTRYQLMQLKAA